MKLKRTDRQGRGPVIFAGVLLAGALIVLWWATTDHSDPVNPNSAQDSTKIVDAPEPPQETSE